MNAPVLESTALYHRRGLSSDKVYRIAIEPSGAGFIVTFAYGRRDSALQSGAKTANPVPIDKARQIYNRLVKQKTAMGYTRVRPGEASRRPRDNRRTKHGR
jgi:bifunctional non-homologous end joining protein LigD